MTEHTLEDRFDSFQRKQGPRASLETASAMFYTLVNLENDTKRIDNERLSLEVRRIEAEVELLRLSKEKTGE